MQLETSFINYAVAVQLGLQAWCLKEVVSLKVNVATLNNEHTEMKTKLSKITIVGALMIGAILCFSGCSTTGGIGDALGKAAAVPGKILNSAVDSVTAVTTNVTTSTLNSGEKVNTTNLTAVASAPVARSIEGAQTIAGWLPPQISGPASILLAGLSGLLTLAVKRRQRELDKTNQDLNSAMDDASNVYNQLTATIQGVEKSVKENTPVKEAIAKQAAKLGVADKLNQTVQATVS